MQDSRAFLEVLYRRYIGPCIALIEAGRGAAALDHYRQMIEFVDDVARHATASTTRTTQSSRPPVGSSCFIPWGAKWHST
jgi:hypothetical protein